MICQKWADEDMPVDAWGNRAELIVAASSTMDRMNLGRPYEHETYGSMEMLTEALRISFNEPLTAKEDDPIINHAVAQIDAAVVQRGTPPPVGHLKQMELAEYIGGDYNKAYEVLLDFYKTVSPMMHAQMTSPHYKGTAEYHVRDVLKKGIYIWVPLNTPKPWMDLSRADGTPVTHEELKEMESEELRTLKIGGVIGDLGRRFPARRGPVWYRGRSGSESVTVDNVLIADTYMLLLEKTGGDWSGVSSARHQHYGLPAKLSKQDKYSLPSRANPVRIFGEAEVRLTTTVTDDDVVAEVMEMSNSPGAHKNVCENILRAEKPSNIEKVLDRKKVPWGSNRSQVFVAHALQTAGIEFFYTDHTDEEEIYPADPIGGMRDMGLVEDEEVDPDEAEIDPDAVEDEDEDEASSNDDNED